MLFEQNLINSVKKCDLQIIVFSENEPMPTYGEKNQSYQIVYG